MEDLKRQIESIAGGSDDYGPRAGAAATAERVTDITAPPKDVKTIGRVAAQATADAVPSQFSFESFHPPRFEDGCA